VNSLPESAARLFNYVRSKKNPLGFLRTIGFKGTLAVAYSLFGYDYVVGRSVSLVLGFVVLFLSYRLLIESGISDKTAFFVVFCAGFLQRFLWSSHVIRPEIYVCVMLSAGLLLMIRNTNKQQPRLTADLVTGVICGLSVWVYYTGIVIVFAFGLTYFIRLLSQIKNGKAKENSLRLISFSVAAVAIVSIWYAVNASFDANFLSNSRKGIVDYREYYLQGVPSFLHCLDRLGGFFRVPRSLGGYFLAPAWRCHIPELFVWIPAVFSSVRRILCGKAKIPEREILLLMLGMWIGFCIAGGMPTYYWILFILPLIVVVGYSAENLLKTNKTLAGMVSIYLIVVVGSQLLLAPYPYRSYSYRRTCSELKSIMAAEKDFTTGIMGPVLYQFSFPGRAFTFDRDFSRMHKEKGTALSEYCSLYGIGYVLVREQDNHAGEEWRLKHPEFEKMGSSEIMQYPGSILLPGVPKRIILSLYMLKAKQVKSNAQ